MGMNKIRLAFLKNLQLVGFFDAGLAWFGFSPYSEENQLNTVVLETPPVITVEVEYFRDPMVYGYGFGLRTTLLGYFLKFDYAWGVDTRAVQDPRVYFSLGYDF
jgi:outer membrane translocation and assembly module TamA